MRELIAGMMSAVRVDLPTSPRGLRTHERVERKSVLGVFVAGALAMAFFQNARAADAADRRIPAHAQIGNTSLPDAKFEFACRSGKGGTLQISVILPEPESVAGFPLDLFEGPDGIGETRDLAEWSVSGAAKPARARTSISGWRGVDGDGFILARARESGHSSDMARLAKRLVASENARLRLVVKPPAHGNALKVEAAVAGHREEIAKALAPCLASVK
ncbi:MAG TPA: hypothetical protein VGO25_01210 [Rhodanobacteraceae bacterium]|jgi:hypothetical protein|nr:hypothetical protein [Rhodanobacteraceae bacterium]